MRLKKGPRADAWPSLGAAHPGVKAYAAMGGLGAEEEPRDPTAPGSPEAQAAGCRCPRLDNLDMAGTGMRTISSACPLHYTPALRVQTVVGVVPPEIRRELVMAAIASQKPEGPQQPLGWHVEVVDLLDVWALGGGWVDSTFTHYPGARLWLDHEVGGRVYYQGFERNGILGWFREDQLGKVRRLVSDQAQPDGHAEPLT